MGNLLLSNFLQKSLNKFNMENCIIISKTNTNIVMNSVFLIGLIVEPGILLDVLLVERYFYDVQNFFSILILGLSWAHGDIRANSLCSFLS